MAYRIKDFSTLDEEIRRIALDQLESALAALADTSMDRADRIHDARKRCKKIRALLRLVRPALKKRTYRQLNGHFRDTSRQVSDERDAAVFIDTYDRVCDRFTGELDRRGTASIRAALTRRLQAGTSERERDEKLERLAADLTKGRQLLEQIDLHPTDFEPLLQGLVRERSRARRGLRAASKAGTPEAHHEWRKRINYHRRHLQLLRSLWPGPIGALMTEAAELGELLGDAHDLAELDRHLQEEPDGLGNPVHVDAFRGYANRLQNDLERDAMARGQRLLAEKNQSLCQRMRKWHQLGVSE